MTASVPDSNRERLLERPRRWLVTGAAGFIGSHLVEALLGLNQRVVGLDNFSTGLHDNLHDVRTRVGEEPWSNFSLIEDDIRSAGACAAACKDANVVLHQAALGSVPRSIKHPEATHEVNVDGFLNVLLAARNARVGRFVYASSSSVYGDHLGTPKVEETVGQPLSPYALTKVMNEMIAMVYARTYALETIGLRYFNVFGPRQSPTGEYAAVIPRWIDAHFQGQPCTIYGDGSTSRDFCYVDNVVQANLLAATVDSSDALNQAFNVAVGQSTSLNTLERAIGTSVSVLTHRPAREPVHARFREGDIAHSLANVSKAGKLLGYKPTVDVHFGLKQTVYWYGRKAEFAAYVAPSSTPPE